MESIFKLSWVRTGASLHACVPYPLPSHGAALLSLPSLSDLAIILFGSYPSRILTVSPDCWSVGKPSSMPFRRPQHDPIQFLLALSVSP
ncbi:uncharacterized protein ARMOST_08593 [Armillaria ostoyae]|uniref:Uncharacterized protein n=1 Tax=Armillaria ostoyae TaxID=47428 RepID=A0A284R924_ARMOS|nr:uncharacterized protein ARMOST_08593 [Armillaria ostoyae]